jgi:hypothetical protein
MFGSGLTGTSIRVLHTNQAANFIDEVFIGGGR